MEKIRKRDSEKAARVKKTAEIVGVDEDSVYRVLRTDRNNDEIVAVYMDLLEQEKKAFEIAKENHLLAAVEKLVPFSSKPQKRTA